MTFIPFMTPFMTILYPLFISFIPGIRAHILLEHNTETPELNVEAITHAENRLRYTVWSPFLVLMLLYPLWPLTPIIHIINVICIIYIISLFFIISNFNFVFTTFISFINFDISCSNHPVLQEKEDPDISSWLWYTQRGWISRSLWISWTILYPQTKQ